MSLNSFPKAQKTVHVVTFTKRRSECKFNLLHTVEYSFLSFIYKRNLLLSYQLSLRNL